MSLIPRMMLLLLACAALLAGIQIPNFVDQYEKRLDAHFLEVQNNLQPFQEIANQFHGGSLDALIEKHERSTDPTFKAEGAAIRNMHERFIRFQYQLQRLKTHLFGKLQILAVDGDRALIRETADQYSFGILLDRNAVIAGVISVAVIVLTFEWIAVMLGWMLAKPARPIRR